MWTTELNGLESGVGRSPATVLCSAHWFDEDHGLLAQGWYDQGVRFLDISDPTEIRQVGYWVTTGTFWGAYYAPSDPTRSIVYGLDVTSGIDVLKIDQRAGCEHADGPRAGAEPLARGIAAAQRRRAVEALGLRLPAAAVGSAMSPRGPRGLMRI